MTKKKIIIAMCIAILFMIVGYSLLSTNLNIKGTSNLTDTWGIKISNVTYTPTGRAYNIEEPTYTDTNMTFNVGVKEPGDKMVFDVTVTNYGTLDAILEKIDATTSGSQLIIYSITGIEEQSKLKSGESLTFQVTTEFDINATRLPQSNKTLNIKLSYVQDDGQSLTPSNPGITDNTLLVKEILANNTPQPDTNIDFSQISSDTNGKGLYYTSTNTEDNKTTYYFRGAVENNYVKLRNAPVSTCTYKGEKLTYYNKEDDNYYDKDITELQCLSTNVCAFYDEDGTFVNGVVGYDSEESCKNDWKGTLLNEKATYETIDELWRIVRINEDGSVRLIRQEIIEKSAFNEEYEDNAYVGYMYGTPGSTTYAATHANINSSTIKTMLDTWYQNNLTNYSSIIADAGSCGDRSVAPSGSTYNGWDTALGYGTNNTIYGPSSRLIPNYGSSGINPQFKCPQSNDLYTTATSTKGNKALTYPIGLITADEVAYAGGVHPTTANTDYYLTNRDFFWTMSPFYFTGSSEVGIVFRDGLMEGHSVDRGWGVRPVINLKSTVEITSGDGTSSNPYVIKTN